MNGDGARPRPIPPALTFRGSTLRAPAWGDAVVLGGLAIVLYGAVRSAHLAPDAVQGPHISLAAAALPAYAARSLARMAAAYALSLGFTLAYGYVAAKNKRAEKLLLPALDVLQSVPILSFLPVVLLSLGAVLPERVAVEIAAVLLLFTSQVWNMTFGWYQSLTTVPVELGEAAATFRFGGWLRFRMLELPHATIGLLWNSMMSWAGGWFFLMAAESFTIGERDFRLPGLGSYLRAAADAGDRRAILVGILVLVGLIVALDQLVWRPLLAWSHRFKVDMVAAADGPTSWFYRALRSSHAIAWLDRRVIAPALSAVDAAVLRRFPPDVAAVKGPSIVRRTLLGIAAAGGLAGALYGLVGAVHLLTRVSGAAWLHIGAGVLATFARVLASLVIAAAWTLPAGTAIGTNRRVAAVLAPIVQILASVPATALFPVVLLSLLRVPFGQNIAAVLLMLMGTQWYLLFNVIAGASEIPEDLRYTARVLGLGRWERWKTLNLPAIFPHVITGAVTATGGAWNASIVAEYIDFGGSAHATIGVGSVIAEATARGDFPVLFASTLAMVAAVVLVNRVVWRPLYRLAERRYRME